MNKKRSIISISGIILLIILFLSGEASALLIGTSKHKGGGPSQITSFDITPFFTASFPFAPLTPWHSPFGTIRIEPGTVGDQFFTDSNDPYFEDTVSLLTNDIDDFIGHKAVFNYDVVPGPIYASGITGAGHESLILTGSGFNGTDFSGSIIDTITLTIDSFSSFTRIMPITGPVTFMEFSYTLTYEQTPVPEPSTILLLGSGLTGLLGFRKKRQKYGG